MHHYPFHPGDYIKDTVHLTLEEDATYRRALDHYYDTEAPLASDKQTLSKRLRVSEQTLSAVLAEFFIETPEGWRHKRCDEEIERYKVKSEKAKRAGSLGGLAKSSGRLANAKQTPSKRLANQNQNQNQNHKGKCTLAEAIAFAVELGQPESDGEACFHKWEGNGWKNGDNAVKDWRATMRSWKIAGYLPSQRLRGKVERNAAYTPERAMLSLKPGETAQDF